MNIYELEKLRCAACSAPTIDASPEHPFCPDHADEDPRAWAATAAWQRRSQALRATILRHGFEVKA